MYIGRGRERRVHNRYYNITNINLQMLVVKVHQIKADLHPEQYMPEQLAEAHPVPFVD